MEFKDIIRQRRSELGLTLEEIGDAVGVAKATVQRWESGEIKNVRRDKIAALSKVLRASPSYLMGWVDGPDPEQKQVPSENKRYIVPVLGRVAAGIPIDAVEEIIDYEEIDEHMAKQGEYFALQIKGNSMNPILFNGDVVIVKKQEDVENGEIAIVLVNGDEATVKRIQKFDGGINLVPSNPIYDVITYTNKQIESLPISILGKVVELRRSF